MNGINKVILVGSVERDPQVRRLPSGAPVCNLRISTKQVVCDKTGERKQLVEWHSVVLFDKLAEIASEHLDKGHSIYIEGSLQTRKWHDKKNGVDRFNTEIRGETMQILGAM